jgi:hypothetical protein
MIDPPGAGVPTIATRTCSQNEERALALPSSSVGSRESAAGSRVLVESARDEAGVIASSRFLLAFYLTALIGTLGGLLVLWSGSRELSFALGTALVVASVVLLRFMRARMIERIVDRLRAHGESASDLHERAARELDALIAYQVNNPSRGSVEAWPAEMTHERRELDRLRERAD